MPSPVTIPKLPPLLIQSGSCIVFQTSDDTLLAWARANEGNLRANNGSGDDALWVDLNVNAWHDNRVHFHIERGRAEFSDIQAERRSFTEVEQKIAEFIELADGNPLCIKSRAVLCVRRSELPEVGIICRLLRTTGTACGVPLSLSGGYLDVDDSLFTKITFSTQEEAGAVHVTLDYRSEDILEGGFLPNADDIAKTGADCFIFERITPEVLSGNHSQQPSR